MQLAQKVLKDTVKILFSIVLFGGKQVYQYLSTYNTLLLIFNFFY